MASEHEKGEIEVEVFMRFLKASQLPIDRNSVEKRSPPEPDILCTHKSEGAIADIKVDTAPDDLPQSSFQWPDSTGV